MLKRSDVLDWDHYFMGIAELSAKRSKDPNTQVGACIVSPEKRIIGTGYNGFPTGCNDDALPWYREGIFIDVKYTYVVHAELNAILNSMGRDMRGATIYVLMFPCNECAKAIIQVGIKEVVFSTLKYYHSEQAQASRRMFDMVGITYRMISDAGTPARSQPS